MSKAASASLNLRDLVFLGVVAAVMFGVARALYPLAMLIGGPVLGGTLVHHGLYALPVGALAALAYLRVRKPGALLVLGAVFALLNLVAIGLWFVVFGFWSGAVLAEFILAALRPQGNDGKPLALALIGGLFIFGLSFFLPLLFTLVLGKPFGFAVVVLSSVVPGVFGAAGGILGGTLATQFRRAGLMA